VPKVSTVTIIGPPPQVSEVSTVTIIGHPPQVSEVSSVTIIGHPPQVSEVSTVTIIGHPPPVSEVSTLTIIGHPPPVSEVSTVTIIGHPAPAFPMPAKSQSKMDPVQLALIESQQRARARWTRVHLASIEAEMPRRRVDIGGCPSSSRMSSVLAALAKSGCTDVSHRLRLPRHGCACRLRMVGTRTTLFSVQRWGASFPHDGGEVGLPVPPIMTVYMRRFV
jgi:phosphohistidine phosphatase SixA